MLFLDTSALVKAYLTEQGTPTVQALFSRMEGRIAITDLVALEVLATLGKNLRTNEIRRKAYVKARDEFLRDYPDAFEVLKIEKPVMETAFSLAVTHKYVGVGAMDMLHVATAVHAAVKLRSTTVVVASSDAGFLRLADACGLRTFDPETQPLGSLLAAWR